MMGIKKRFQLKFSPFLISLMAGNLVFLLIIGLRGMGTLEGIELEAYDIMYLVRPQTEPMDTRITLVDFTDEGQRKYGWPLPDKELVQLFESLLSHSPRVIGLDMYRDLPVPSKDCTSHIHELNDIFINHENIIVNTKIADKKGAFVAPPPVLKGTPQVAFNDLITDSGVIRRGMLFADDGINYYDYFGLAMALKYLEPENIYIEPLDEDRPELLKLGKSHLTPLDSDFGGFVNMDDAGYQFMFTYPGDPAGFNRLTVDQVLNGRFDPEQVKDKIIIIGVNADSTPDFFYTPFSKWRRDEQRVTGSAIHGFATSQLLNMALEGKGTINSLGEKSELLWTWFCTLFGSIICIITRKGWRTYVLSLAGFPLVCITGYTAFMHALWIPIAAPALGGGIASVVMMTYLIIYDRRQKMMIKDAFGHYLSPEVVKNLIADPSTMALGGEERIMTAFFSDVQGFSAISENLTPHELVLLLNEYLTSMCSIIIKYNGTIDKFEGDAIIAFWGAPAPLENHAVMACMASLDMQEELVWLRKRWEKQNRPLMHVRIGLNSGPMVVGNMGSEQRVDYTIMGDSVNLAARLEGINKFYHSFLIISEYTYKMACDHIDVRELDTIRVVGKQDPVVIYELLGRKNQVTGSLREVMDCYEKGLALYRNQAFEKAAESFEKALAVRADGPCETMLARCRQYMITSPPGNWDGIYTFTQKG